MGKHSSHDLFLDVTEIEINEQALMQRAREAKAALKTPKTPELEVTGKDSVTPEGFDPVKSSKNLLQKIIARMKQNWNS